MRHLYLFRCLFNAFVKRDYTTTDWLHTDWLQQDGLNNMPGPDICALLPYNAAFVGTSAPTFRGQPIRSHVQGSESPRRNVVPKRR
jgi:hypothetical protein